MKGRVKVNKQCEEEEGRESRDMSAAHGSHCVELIVPEVYTSYRTFNA